MQATLEKALVASRESKAIEFKRSFDSTQPGAWCDLFKDVVAIANSGGGVIIFGLDDFGEPADGDIDSVIAIDPADIANRLGRYIGKEEIELQVLMATKHGRNLVAWLIGPSLIPITFEKPGTSAVDGGKQRTSFGEGTTYFRHGAKSEPGTTADTRRSVERYVEELRHGWMSGLKQIVAAPLGSSFTVATGHSYSGALTSVRAVTDPKAPPVRLTRNAAIATGSFLHEEISDALFSEINNVIDSNRLLFKGQDKFLLGPQVYYRIYAERQHVLQPEAELAKLLYSGVTDYMPTLYWYTLLPSRVVAERLAAVVLCPKGNEVQTLVRTAPLLGKDFCLWLNGKFQARWGNFSQPPVFSLSFRTMVEAGISEDPVILASKLPLGGLVDLPDGSKKPTKELMADKQYTSSVLSQACLQVFNGNKGLRGLCRSLDYLVYGKDVASTSMAVAEMIKTIVGDRLPTQEQT